MPNTGDYIKKEREGLDLIIKMHRQNQRKAVPIGELLLFIVLPLLIAGGIWKHKELKEYAQGNEQISTLIKKVYPEWKSLADLAPPPLPIDQAGLPGETGQPLQPGAERPAAVPADGAAPAATSETGTASPYQQPAASSAPVQAPAPELQGPADRGTLLH